MQIRLTVLAPRSGQTPARACDVLVTAPAGTALAAVASGLAQSVSGPEGSQGGGAVVLFAGRERLDSQRIALGEPPLVDGAVLSLQVPGEDEAADDTVPAQLHVVAGPDAGGVHLLHGGQIRIGRSAEADVPLDDPDVSRLHCAVTVSEDGRVSVADLGSTNGTSLDGAEVRDRPVRFPSGALLRLGESALRLTAGSRTRTLPTAPDGEGHLRVSRVETEPHTPDAAYGGPPSSPSPSAYAHRPEAARQAGPVGYGSQGPGPGHGSPEAAARQRTHGHREEFPGGGAGEREPFDPASTRGSGREPFGGGGTESFGAGSGTGSSGAGETPRRGGIGAWARRLKGGGGSRGEQAQGAEQPGRGSWPEAGAAPSGHAPFSSGHAHASAGHAPEAPGSDPYASSFGSAGSADSFASAGSFGDAGATSPPRPRRSPPSPPCRPRPRAPGRIRRPCC